MTAIHQLVATLAPFDAVSNEAVALRDGLRAAGVASEIYCEHRAAGAAPALGLDALPDDGLVLLHHSIGSAVVELAAARVDRLAVRAHNVTPPTWFAGVNDEVAELCRRGIAALPRLARARVAIAASEFTAIDLRAAGFADVRVAPILLPEGPPHPAPTPDLARPLVLAIGRIAPNKRVDELLRAFAAFRRGCAPRATLEIVGVDDGFAAYGDACRRLARRLGIDDATRFRGRIDEAAKDALLGRAAAYLTLSEHEGFCVPVVEAFRRDVPVVARAFAALPETIGGGLCVPASTTHGALAELLGRLVDDRDLRASVLAAQRRELPRLSSRAALDGLVGALVEAAR